MIADGPRYPIWFTNLIYGNSLYTVTYKWPRVPLDRIAAVTRPARPAIRVPFALDDIYVGQKGPSQWWQGLPRHPACPAVTWRATGRG